MNLDISSWCIKSSTSSRAVKPWYGKLHKATCNIRGTYYLEDVSTCVFIDRSIDLFKTKEEAKRAYIKAEEAHINNLFREWALAVNSLNNFKDTLGT